MGGRKCVQSFGWKLKEKDLSEDIGVDGKILEWNFRMGGNGFDPSVSVRGQAVDLFETTVINF
jgi:hypothetical protein